MPRPQLELETIVEIPTGGSVLRGQLAVPERACGVVVFAPGDARQRRAPRDRRIGERLREQGHGTLRFGGGLSDELRADRPSRRTGYDIEVAARRLIGVERWLADHPRLHDRRVGFFASRTAAAAALLAAADLPRDIDAIVSRAGRPDLAGEALSRVCAPTLLVVGGRDKAIINMNRQALEQLRATKSLEIIPDASHLFREPGELEAVARLAGEWFCTYLGTPDYTL